MSLKLDEAFEIPTELSALEFVVRIRGGDRSPQELVDEYVLTPGVRRELERILATVRSCVDRGDDLGWFVHGSFGSGKSHFMAVLACLLENEDFAWSKDDPAVAALGAQHRPWLAGHRLLVVRENLMSASAEGGRLDRMLYNAVNRELRERGQPEFEFLNVGDVLAEARREAEQYGERFYANMAARGILASAADLAAILAGPLDDRERFARLYLEYRGRDPASAGFSPSWGEGLHRLARHVKERGYAGLVLLLDELLLWLSGRTGPEYKEAINHLNVIVDHSDGTRAVPMLAFVARQRRFSEFFPDMVDEEQLHDHLDHHAGRFELTTLEDVELRHIVKQRVLRRRRPDEVERALDQVAQRHQRVLREVLQSADLDYVRDVFPFHPALIEMLIDVSSLLQRDRTALRLVYEMLMANRQMALGDFLPVGGAFDFVFPREGVVGSRKIEQLASIRSLYFDRLQPSIAAMLREGAADGFDEARAQALRQVVKTALLAKVSSRLKGGALTVERLVRLNESDVSGTMDRGRMTLAQRDLVALSQRQPTLRVVGSGGTAEVDVSVDMPMFADIIARARSKVDHAQRRHRTFLGLFTRTMGLDRLPGFGEGQPNDARYSLEWRSTRRTGTVAIANVRELPYDRFRAQDGQFRVIVDLPWDDPGHSVEEDRQRIYAVRKSHGSAYTVCWLPRHFTERELALLTDLSASELVASPEGRDELLVGLSPADRQQIADLAAERARSLRAEVQRALESAYRDQGEALAVISEVDESVRHPRLDANLDCLGRALLDRRYPQHPRFAMEPRAAELGTLLEWMLCAAEAADLRAGFDDRVRSVLDGLGMPLELVELGQTRGRLRLDTRYVGYVLDQLSEPEVLWAPIDMALEEQFGLQPAVRNALLCFALRHKSYRAVHEIGRAPITDLAPDNRARTGLLLQRARLLDPAQWSRARDLGTTLVGLAEPPRVRTLNAQDEWAERLRSAGSQRRTELLELRQALGELAAQGGERLQELDRAIARLAPLADDSLESHGLLAGLLELWPDDSGDPLRAVVRGGGHDLQAVAALDRRSLGILQARRDDPAHGAAAQRLLEELRGGLARARREALVEPKALCDWNRRAWRLVETIIAPTSVPAGSEPGVEPVGDPGAARTVEVLKDRVVDARDARDLDEALDAVREAVGRHAGGEDELRLDVTLRVRPRSGRA